MAKTPIIPVGPPLFAWQRAPRRGCYSPCRIRRSTSSYRECVMTQMAFLLPLLVAAAGVQQPAARTDLVRDSVQALIKMQEDGGQWPYEGVYRVNKELPIGYRVGGTSIVAMTLMHAASADKDAQTAVSRALGFVLKGLDDPLMAPSTEPRYDVRVWGHACALEFFCHLRAQKAAGDRAREVDAWINKLVE